MLKTILFTGLCSQDRIRIDWPEQYRPLLTGLQKIIYMDFFMKNSFSIIKSSLNHYFGLSQYRCDFCIALPHVRVHDDQADQSLQFPSITLKSLIYRH